VGAGTAGISVLSKAVSETIFEESAKEIYHGEHGEKKF
jgi:hypothetical protein